MLGQVTNGRNLHLPDMSLREVVLFVPLIAWAIWIGVYPKPYFDLLEKPVQQIVERVRPGYYEGDLRQKAKAKGQKAKVLEANAASVGAGQ